MIIYDLEIQNLIPPKNGEFEKEFTYCNGWTDYAGMRLACAVVYDQFRQEYSLFDENDIESLRAKLTKTDCIVGHNILKFDNNLLAEYEIKIPKEKCFDTLLEIAKAAGTPNDFSGLGLEAICQANFQTAKSGNGADAPKWFQQGNFGRLFNYCQADVRLTKMILDRILETGHIINPRTGKWIRVNRPR